MAKTKQPTPEELAAEEAMLKEQAAGGDQEVDDQDADSDAGSDPDQDGEDEEEIPVKKPRRRVKPAPVDDDTDGTDGNAILPGDDGEEDVPNPARKSVSLENTNMNDGLNGDVDQVGLVDYDELVATVAEASEDAVEKAVTPLIELIGAQGKKISRLSELLLEKSASDNDLREKLGKAVGLLSQYGEAISKGLVSAPVAGDDKPVLVAGENNATVPNPTDETVVKSVIQTQHDNPNDKGSRVSKALVGIQTVQREQRRNVDGGYDLMAILNRGDEVPEEILARVEKGIASAV